jgi:hypothetical protein
LTNKSRRHANDVYQKTKAQMRNAEAGNAIPVQWRVIKWQGTKEAAQMRRKEARKEVSGSIGSNLFTLCGDSDEVGDRIGQATRAAVVLRKQVE